MSSTRAQAGSYTSGSHGRRQRGNPRNYSGRRLADWSTSNDNDRHVDDRIACGPLRSDLTTRDHLGSAFETVQRFHQTPFFDRAAEINTDAHHVVGRSMYPESIDFDYPPTPPRLDQSITTSFDPPRGSRSRQRGSSVHGTSQWGSNVPTYGQSQGHGVASGSDVHDSLDHRWGSTNTLAFDHTMFDGHGTITTSHDTRHDYGATDWYTTNADGSVPRPDLDWDGYNSHHHDPAFYQRRP